MNLILNLIKYWSFKIYILLDRNGINAFIERYKLSLFGDDYEDNENEIKIKLMTNNISNQIFN